MRLCKYCRGGEIPQCSKCGGSGWFSDTDLRRKRGANVISKEPPICHPSERLTKRRKKPRKTLSVPDTATDAEQLARRQRIREEDDAAWQARQNHRHAALQKRHEEELAAKRERCRVAEERRQRRRLQEAANLQQDMLQRNLRPAGSLGTIVGPSKNTAAPSGKKRKAKSKVPPKRG